MSSTVGTRCVWTRPGSGDAQGFLRGHRWCLFPCAGPGCAPVAVAPSLTSDPAHWAPSICPSIWVAVSDLLTALGSCPDSAFCAPVWRTLRWRGWPSVPLLSVLPGRGLESVSWRLVRHQLPYQQGWSPRANVRFQHERRTPANGSAAADECEFVLKVKGRSDAESRGADAHSVQPVPLRSRGNSRTNSRTSPLHRGYSSPLF